MKPSTDRILVTQVGSLPRPNDQIELYRDDAPDDNLQPRLRSSIADIVRRQVAAGSTSSMMASSASRCRLIPPVTSIWQQLTAFQTAAHDYTDKGLVHPGHVRRSKRKSNEEG
jgi:hypothetical protein